MKIKTTLVFLVLFVSALGVPAFAVSQVMTISGHIAKPDGSDLISSSVTFEFSISNPAGTCIVYTETSGVLDLSTSNGNFEAYLGTGTVDYPSGGTLKDILSNAVALNCDGGGTYTPAASDGRLLSIQFKDNTESSPAYRAFTTNIPLTSVPSAFYAESASKLGTNSASDFVLKTGIPTCSAGDFLSWNGTALTCGSVNLTSTVASVSSVAPVSISGTVSAPVVSISQATTVQNGYLSSADFNTFNNKLSTSLTSGQIWVGSGANIAAAVTLGGDVLMSNAGAVTVKKIQGKQVSATAPTLSGQVLKYDGSTQYAPGFIGYEDLRSSVSPTTKLFEQSDCASNETMFYQSATDTFPCQLISVLEGQINFSPHSQNSFLASPANATGVPTFRTIAASDVSNVAFVKGGNSFGSFAMLGTDDNFSLIFKTNGNQVAVFEPSGNFGIGTPAPRTTLDVAGAIVSAPGVSNASGTINFLSSNMQYTANSCGAFAFHHLKDGGAYMFVVKGTGSSLCSFTAFSDAGGTALTVHLPPDHGLTIAGKHTIYNIAVLGSDVYLSWTPGY